MTHSFARALALLAALVALAPAAAAQGTLSTQGFGYPPGELSARAAATGGAIGEFDATSVLNPAAVALFGITGIYAQYAPELRTVSGPDGSDRSLVSRFPLLGVFVRLGDRGALALTATTLLDRSWTTSRADTAVVTDRAIPFVEEFRSTGAIDDLRLAGAWRVGGTFRVGLAGHVFTGQSRLAVARTFADSSFAPFSQRSSVGYLGTGVSAGVEWQPVRAVAIAASGRLGGRLTARSGDTTLGRARVPARWGGALSFTGVRGAALTASAEWTQWSALNGLAPSNLRARDGWAYAAGVEVRGPTAFGAALPLRLGARRRTLPFPVGRTSPTSTGDVLRDVTETTLSAGTGVPLARGRASVDVALLRALRSAGTDTRERAWILSLGVTVRP